MRGTAELCCEGGETVASSAAAAAAAATATATATAAATSDDPPQHAPPEDLLLEVLEVQPSTNVMAVHPTLPLFALGTHYGTVTLYDSRTHTVLGELCVPKAVEARARGTLAAEMALMVSGAGGAATVGAAAAAAAAASPGAGSFGRSLKRLRFEQMRGEIGEADWSLSQERRVSALAWEPSGTALFVTLAPVEGEGGAGEHTSSGSSSNRAHRGSPVRGGAVAASPAPAAAYASPACRSRQGGGGASSRQQL